MAKKKNKPRSPKRVAGRKAYEYHRQLQKIEELIDRKRWMEALELLQPLEWRYPNRPEVISDLAFVYAHIGDMRQHQEYCERLVALLPNNADMAYMLAGAYLNNVRPFLALPAFHQALERWPDHRAAAQARQTVADLEVALLTSLAEMHLTGDDAWEIAAWHEEVQSFLEQGKYARARQKAEQILSRHPQFVAALNNISESYFLEGQLDQAIAASQRVLAFAPNNLYALANLTRFAFLGGRPAEAQSWAERLQAVEPPIPDGQVKKAEAFSYLGNDQAVLDAFLAAERDGMKIAPPQDAYLYHLAGVAYARMGQEDQARRHWKEALKRLPMLHQARNNLDNLDRPVGEQYAPWPFDLPQWVSRDRFKELSSYLRPAAKSKNNQAVTEKVRQFLKVHPELVTLVPVLLDRGGPEAGDFTLRLVMMAETPELLGALRDFALGQRGPDQLRLQAADVLARFGVIPAGKARLWLRGAWTEVAVFGYELHDEILGNHSPQVRAMMEKIQEALHGGDGARAEQLLKKALALDPNSPNLQNNLARAYSMQGRNPEGLALIRQVHERHPDYLFARVNLAHNAVHEGDLNQAKVLLEPLLNQRRLHYSELASLCGAQIDLLLAEGKRDDARSWFQMWERADPENPLQRYWRDRLDQKSWLKQLLPWRS